MEIWKPIEGYETQYMVSDHGNVKSVARIVPQKNGRTRRAAERLLTKRHVPGGYLKVSLWKENKEQQILIHRLVAKHFLPEPAPERIDVNHINCIKTDNHADNLEWVTKSENMRHALENGLLNLETSRVSATENPKKAKKLTKEAVEDIRKLRGEGWTFKALGKKHNVSRQMASLVCSGKHWK